jgi:hypothetical protein
MFPLLAPHPYKFLRLTSSDIVSLSRAKCVRSSEQRCRRRPQDEQRSLQEKCEDCDGWRFCARRILPTSTEMSLCYNGSQDQQTCGIYFHRIYRTFTSLFSSLRGTWCNSKRLEFCRYGIWHMGINDPRVIRMDL